MLWPRHHRYNVRRGAVNNIVDGLDDSGAIILDLWDTLLVKVIDQTLSYTGRVLRIAGNVHSI